MALLILVGGPASIATVMLVRKQRGAYIIAMIPAGAITIFEAVEISVIGSPEGIARNLQVVYLVSGLSIAILALIGRSSERRSHI